MEPESATAAVPDEIPALRESGTESTSAVPEDLEPRRCVEQVHQPRRGETPPTIRAIPTGCLLRCVVAAMNIHFELETRWPIGGSSIAAIRSLIGVPEGQGIGRVFQWSIGGAGTSVEGG